MYYILESTDERRARRNNDIKKLFQQLTIEENMSFMEAYEAIGYVFYISAAEVRRILATMNRSVQNAHNLSPKKHYLCTGFPPEHLRT